MWARNLENVNHVPRARNGGQGIYILYDGSTPVYIGKGNIRTRLRQHRRSKRLGQLWDHFSWYVPLDGAFTHDLEALLLRLLPFYLRSLTRQRGIFQEAEKRKVKPSACDVISRRAPSRNSKPKDTKRRNIASNNDSALEVGQYL
jgi:hypothetical protein